MPPKPAEAPKAGSAGFTIDIGSGSVVTNEHGRGSISILLTKETPAEFGKFGIGIEVDGADIAAITTIPAAGEDLLDRGIVRANGQFTRVRLELSNLVPLQRLKINTVRMDFVSTTTPPTWKKGFGGPSRDLTAVPPPPVVRDVP